MKRYMISRRVRGFGLVELMIALVLCSFLMLGLATMVGNIKGTYGNQTEFAAINDKERYATSLLGNLATTAGYFSLTQVTQAYLTSGQAIPTAASVMPIETASGYSYVAGQGISGSTGSSATTPDTLNVRFQVINGDGASPFNCLGQTAAPTGSTGSQLATGVYESQISVVASGSSSNLVCQTGSGSGLGTTQTVLIDGVTNMKVLYGFDSAGTGSVSQYLPASSISGANWNAVHSVQVTLTFNTTTMVTPLPPFVQTYNIKATPQPHH